MRRHALSNAQWAKLKPVLPKRQRGPASHRGDRLFIDAVLFRFKTGLPWRDLPAGATSPCFVLSSHLVGSANVVPGILRCVGVRFEWAYGAAGVRSGLLARSWGGPGAGATSPCFVLSSHPVGSANVVPGILRWIVVLASRTTHVLPAQSPAADDDIQRVPFCDLFCIP